MKRSNTIMVMKFTAKDETLTNNIRKFIRV